MPDLSQKLIDELEVSLSEYLADKGAFTDLSFISAGGSAAVFRAKGPDGLRAFKIFDPNLFSKENSKESNRLELQKRLIGHSCPNLIQTYNIELHASTAIIEMEFIGWPRLKEALKEVPESSIITLIKKLVNAVQYLETIELVHRDIKPENIHISPDFEDLILLDLGVIREFNPAPDTEDTDHGQLRPFMATAQYSSPEYLFRLDPPSDTLWRGLNIYQVGAILHDLTTKDQIYNAEMASGNRWTLAKAVLTKMPNFSQTSSATLNSLKALACRCLNKNIDIRLATVCWQDFHALESENSVQALQRKLNAKKGPNRTSDIERTIRFQRQQYQENFGSALRERLIPTTGTNLPFKISTSTENFKIEIVFSVEEKISKCVVSLWFDWQDGVNFKNADLYIGAGLFKDQFTIQNYSFNYRPVCSIDNDENHDIPIQITFERIAEILSSALDLTEILKQQHNDPENQAINL